MSFGGTLPDILKVPTTPDPSAATAQPGTNGAVATTPSVGASAPPNVNGGAAGFSLDTSAIKDMITAKQAELNASMGALTANTNVDRNAEQQQLAITDQNLDAYSKIQKTQALPGGAGGKIAKIFGIFDSDYNVEKHATTIKMGEMKSASIKATADAIKAQNNELPTILGKVSEATQQIWQAQKDANQLTINYGTLQTEMTRAATEKARLNLEITKDRREQIQFNISKMSTAQVQQQLDLANQGKGPYKDAPGLLEHHLVSEQKATADMELSQTQAAKGQREESDASASDFVSNLPVDFTKGMLAQAQKANSPTVDFTVGKNPDGSPKVFSVATPLVQAGLIKSAKMEDDANKAVAADQTQRLNIIPNATQIVNVGNAFARMNPAFTQLTQQTGAIMKGMDTGNPSSVRQSGLLLQDIKDKQTAMVKSTAAQFGTKPAQDAVIDYGTNGKFTPTGGVAVVADSAGIPSLASQALYKDAFGTIQTIVATKLSQQGGAGSASIDMNNPADTQMMLQSLMQQKGGKEKINQITQEALLDPSNRKAIADNIGKVVQTNGINHTLYGLAMQKNADPIWHDMYEHSDQIVTNKRYDPQKIGQLLEEASIKSGGKINYGKMFLQGFSNYTANSDNDPASDPSYTVYDHALEAAVYGDMPHQAVLGGLATQIATQMAKAHQAMKDRIKQDITGQTQRQAVGQATQFGNAGIDASVTAEAILQNPKAINDIANKTGIQINNVPSATGTGLTVQQIMQMFPGG